MMHDMADNMMSVSGDMGKGGMSAARQKQMGDRMREMAMMMENMSGMMGKGMMLDAEQQQKMGDMRKQIDAMPLDTVNTPSTALASKRCQIVAVLAARVGRSADRLSQCRGQGLWPTSAGRTRQTGRAARRR